MSCPKLPTDKGNIKKFEITPNGGGNPVDISGSITQYYYYESIFDNSRRVVVNGKDAGYRGGQQGEDGTFIGQEGDTSNLMTELNTGGGEQVEIETEDASENTQEMTMFIDKVSPNDEGTQTTGFTMELVSKEVLNQRQASIRKRYDGKISDSVNSILTDPLPNGLGTDKPININPDTVNEYSFWGNGRTPFYWCVTLAKKGIGSNPGKSAGYLFFENKEGFNFIAIDTLFEGEDYVKKLIYTDTYQTPEGYDGKIISYTMNKTVDVEKSMMMGNYNNELQSFNPFDNAYQETPLTSEDTEGGLKFAGTEFASKLVNTEFTQYPSRFFSQVQDIGTLPKGTDLKAQLKTATEENLSYQDVTAQSSMRYDQLMSIQLTITTGGFVDLKVGDKVFCDFPDPSAAEGTKSPSEKNSGIYIIAELCHNLTPKASYSKFILIRDSFGR